MRLVTGGAGFIGTNFIRQQGGRNIVNLDKLTYAGNRTYLTDLEAESSYTFVHGDICNSELVMELLQRYQPKAIIHFAAESHVDRSIVAPAPFIETNMVGTATLLDAALKYWRGCNASFRFIHVSTDEVYGTLDMGAPPADETSPFAPNSPYAASKAGADGLVRAYHRTYGLPTIITRSSNNFGPYQYPEKLIPLTIVNALTQRTIPIYGHGMQRRNWLYVSDHCNALERILENGVVGESYNIAADNEMTNLELVTTVCDAVAPHCDGYDPKSLITHIDDRPGHDGRYSLDATKLWTTLEWQPAITFTAAIEATVAWYLTQYQGLLEDGTYQTWIQKHYGGRL